VSSAPAPRPDRRRQRGHDTREQLLDAAARVVGRDGYAATSTRAVAAEAEVPLSLVHYHFGSRGHLLAAVLERENERLLARQRAAFAEPRSLAEHWRAAAAYLEDDVASGYVRRLWELWAAGLSDPELARTWHSATEGWIELIAATIERWADANRVRLPVPARTVAELVANVYQGMEVSLLAAGGDPTPQRAALEAVGDLIAAFERSATEREPQA
jgi:AcrR family transcriptional regulator